MKEIKKIVIKSTSGFCPIDFAYSDKLTITESSIKYEYTPLYIAELNQVIEWSYKTNSEIFANIFKSITKQMEEILNPKIMVRCMDAGKVEFIATYADKKRKSIKYYCPSYEFEDFFNCVRQLVPSIEETPEILRTGEDFE